MTNSDWTSTGLHIMGRLAQVAAGVFAGVIVVGLLWRVLPFSSAMGVFVGSVVVTLSSAIALGFGSRRFRLGASALAVSSTALNVLVAIVVV